MRTHSPNALALRTKRPLQAWAALGALIIGIAAAGCGSVLAQTLPNRPVRLIAGHGPGGQADLIARIIAPKLAELWGEPVIVENRVGAAGTIAAAFVARANPDGHTLLILSSTSLVFTALTVKDLSYDPTRDLTMVGRVASIPTVLAVRSSVPAKNLPELVALARKRPGQLSAGSSGIGSSSGFALEMLKGAAGIDILAVPYGGAGQVLTGILSGQVDMVFAPFGLVDPHVKTGALRLIATTGSERISAAPDLATIREQGFDRVTVDSYIGIAAPGGISAETLARLSDGLSQALRMPDVRQRLLDLGFDPVEDTPARYAAALREDLEKYSVIVERMGLRNAK